MVSRYGILERTVATDLGSTVETENLAYDTESGEVLATATINNFNDPVYNFTFPAHWSYDRMGPAFKNIGLSIVTDIDGTVGLNKGEVTTNNGALDISDYLVPGDEVLVAGSRYWIWDDNLTDSKVYIIDEYGNSPYSTVETNVVVKVIRSGRRNLQTTPVGSITSLKNPIRNGTGYYAHDVYPLKNAILYASNGAIWNSDDWEVVNASAMEFSEDWKMKLTPMYLELEGTGAQKKLICI